MVRSPYELFSKRVGGQAAAAWPVWICLYFFGASVEDGFSLVSLDLVVSRWVVSVGGRVVSVLLWFGVLVVFL